MILRKYAPEDCGQLAELFYHTVHTVNAADYSPEHPDAWAAGCVDLAAWNRSFLEHFTVVAMEGETKVGFGDIDSSGYLDMLYGHAEYQGQGNILSASGLFGDARAACDAKRCGAYKLRHGKAQGIKNRHSRRPQSIGKPQFANTHGERQRLPEIPDVCL